MSAEGDAGDFTPLRDDLAATGLTLVAVAGHFPTPDGRPQSLGDRTRRHGDRSQVYPHPDLEPVLAKTLGVPLFQEQLMHLAVVAAGFSPGEADVLRRAMGSKRSVEKMEALRQRLYDGMATKGITGAAADDIYTKIKSFAAFGFPVHSPSRHVSEPRLVAA